MPGPPFTVAMPAYNSAGTIEPAIESVLAQTRNDFELVVVDDGSVDETAARARRYESDPRVRVLSREHSGLAASRNAAIEYGGGAVIAMLDSDDLWLPHYLEVMSETLEAHPEAGFAYTDAWVLDDATRRIRRTTAMTYQDPPDPPPAEPREFLVQLLRANFVFAGAAVRRSALDAAGRYNERLWAGEDYELWLRIVAHGFRAVRAPGLLAVYRKSPGTLSTKEELMLSGVREVYRLVAEEYLVPDEIRSVARARQRAVERALAGRKGEPGLLPALARARARAVRIKSAVVEPFAWHRRPPPAVAALLANANADQDDARSNGNT
jgi:GT2 family glycosyltransferase